MTGSGRGDNCLRRLQALPLWLLLVGGGLAGNSLGFDLFFDVRFVFGSIFAMLVLQFSGLRAGVLAAAAIASITYPLWNHPYTILTSTAELLVVGVLIRRWRLGLVVADSLFWLLLGLPLVYLCYRQAMGIAYPQVLVTMLAQGLNGIANTLLARLLFMALAGYLRRLRFSLREVLFNLLALAVLLSALLLFTGQSRDRMVELDRSIRSSLLLGQERVTANLVKWLDSRLGVVVFLAQQAPGAPLAAMQLLLTQVQGMENDFLRLALVDREARSIACAPLHDELGQLNLGKNYGDRPFLPELQARRLPMLSELLLSKVGRQAPVVILLAPVLKEGEYDGFLAGVLNLELLGGQIALNIQGQLVAGIHFTLVDNKNRVIVSNRPELRVMAPFVRPPGTFTPLGEGVRRWLPLKHRNVSLAEGWENSLYVTETTVGPLAEWKLILELPLGPMLKKLSGEFALRLSEVLLLFLSALSLASFLSHRLIAALEELMRGSALIPAKLLTRETMAWPESKILEIDQLSANYREMALALARQFQEIRDLNLGLEGKVDARTLDLQESERRFRSLSVRLNTLVNNLPVGVILEDENRKILAANRQLCALFAIPLAPEALVGGDGQALVTGVSPLFAEPGRFLARIEELLAGGEAVWNEEWLLADGRVVERDYKSVTIGGQDRGSLWNYREISERKAREKQLQQSLLEKETLLREVHHRVKNNMAVISSLLALQAGKIEEESLREVFAESQQRVKSLALIHEKLYQAADVAHIDFGDYLRVIVKELLSFHRRSGEAVTAAVEAEAIVLDIDTAIPCGLMVNELLTNALKYAFPAGRGGEIKVAFTRAGQSYTLTVSDNGVGLPPGFDYRRATSLGLQLVEALTAQIRGTWQLTSRGGTEVVITFQGKGA